MWHTNTSVLRAMFCALISSITGHSVMCVVSYWVTGLRGVQGMGGEYLHASLVVYIVDGA